MMTSDAIQAGTERYGRRRFIVAALISACALLLTACGGDNTNTANAPAGNKNQNGNVRAEANSNTLNTNTGNTNQPAPPTGKNPVAVIETEAGTIKVELLRSEAPVTVENFVQLANSGYYTNIIFHRVINGFMIQGGDPTGTGGGGKTATGQPLPNEVNLNSPVYQGGYKAGIVAMANKGGDPRTGSSQFFIMHKDNPRLPREYTIFGRVLEGMNVVDKIATAPVSGERPLTPIKMKKVSIQ